MLHTALLAGRVVGIIPTPVAVAHGRSWVEQYPGVKAPGVIGWKLS